MPLVFALAATLCSVASTVPYVRDMLYGTTRPNLVSVSLWFSLIVIMVAAQFSAGASWSIALPITSLLCVGTILFFAARGYGYARYGAVDGACLVLGLSALALWYFTDDPRVAIALVVAASFLAAVPTIIKVYRDPPSEHAFAWFLTVLAGCFGLVSTSVFDFTNVIYPIYVICEAGIICMLAYAGQRIGAR